MLVDVANLPAEAAAWRNVICIVVDVLRASSTMVTLFERGCNGIWTAGSVAEARRLKAEHGLPLGGERNGLPPQGFDFGNSPTALAALDLAGRRVIFTTSNGTAALRRLDPSLTVLIGCLLNATACVSQGIALAQQNGGSVGIVCAGRNRRFVLDDAICAGYLVEAATEMLREQGDEPRLTDSALAARQLYHSYPDILTPFALSDSGKRIAEIGMVEDLAYCAQTDASRMVPYLAQRDPFLIECSPY